MRAPSGLVPVEYALPGEGSGCSAGSGTMMPLLARLHTAQLAGQPHGVYAAWLEAARGWVETGACAAAEAHYEQALRWSRLLGGIDAAVEVMCEVAELDAVHGERLEREEAGSGRGERRRARAYAQQAARLAEQVADPSWEIAVLLRVSDVLDRCGSRDEALALQVRAVQLKAAAGAA
jgi:hypothetical protein